MVQSNTNTKTTSNYLKVINYKNSFLFTCLFVFSLFADAATFTITNGNTLLASATANADIIIIEAGGTLSMNAVRSYASVSTANNGTSIITGTSALTITGNLTIAGGNTLSFASTGNVTLQGSLVTSGTGTANLTGRNLTTVTASSTLLALTSATPTISGTSDLNIGTGTITVAAGETLTTNTNVSGATVFAPNATGTATLSGTGTLILSGNLTIGSGNGGNTGTCVISSGFTVMSVQIEQGANNANKLLTNNGTIKVSGAIAYLGSVATTNNTGSTFEYNGAAQTVFAQTYYNLILSGTGLKTFGATTINAVHSIQGQATVAGTTPTYGTNATLEYAGSIAQATSTEFPASFNGTGGVIINNASGVTLGSAKAIAGTTPKLIIGSTVPNSVFNDGGFQLTTTGTLTLTSGTLNLGSVSTATTLPAFATKNYSSGTTVAFISGVAQTVAATSYPNLTFSGNGTKTTASGTITVSENWSVSGGTAALNTNNSNVTVTGNLSGSGNITSGSGTITLSGSWSNNGTFTANSGTVVYNGTSQTIAGLTYNNLTINQSAGSATLGGSATVNSTFTLTTGNLILGSNNLVIGTSGTISLASPSASKMIIASGSGELRKNYTATGSFVFPIGDNTGTLEYSPVTVNLTAGSGFSSAYIGVNVTDAKHPDNSSTTHFISRYWNIKQSGITNATATITGTYLAADINGTQASAKSAQLNGTFNQTTNPWVKFVALGSNTLTATGATLTSGQVSAFTGITNADPTVNITGGGVTICNGNSVGLTANPTGDATFIYNWSPGTGLSSTTVSNPSASPSSTTVYTVTVRDGNGITASANTTITVSPIPTTAAAGADQVNIATCGLTQVTLAANTPSSGTGEWSIISGSGGSFTDSSIATTTFTGIAGNSYTLRWTISSNPCADSFDEVNIKFNIASTNPTSATASLLTICPSVNVDLDVVGGSLGTDAVWIWYSGSCGGTPEGTGAQITVSPTVTTTYYVRAENICGNTICRSVTVTVDPGTLATMPGGITGSIITCNGATGVQYSVQPAPNAASYSWTLPAGVTQATGGNTRIITVDFPTPYSTGDICVVSRNACNIPSATRCKNVKNVAVYTPARIDGSTNVCLNATGLIYSTPSVSGSTSYNWSLPTGMIITSGAGTREITVDAGPAVTSGPLCLTVSNACGTSLSICINIVVSSATMPGGITGTSSTCANTNGLVYSVQPVSGAISYTWTTPAGMNIVSGQTTRIITVDVGPSPVAGNICVTANFACGGSTPRCKGVTINGLVPGGITGKTNVCSGANGVSYSIGAVINATGYNWTLPSGITLASGANTNSITVNIDNNFLQGDICVTLSSACGTSAPSCLAVKNFSQVLPGGMTGPALVCRNTTGITYSIQPVADAISYDWFVPAGVTITSGLNTRLITVDIDNNFSVGDIGVRAVSNCPSNSLIRWKSITVNPGIPETINASAIICPGTTVTFSISPAISGISTYAWTLPQGMTFTIGPPTNGSSVSVDIGAGFRQGDVCVNAVSSCGGSGFMKCQSYNIIPATPGTISGPLGVCAPSAGISYSVTAVPGVSSYYWDVPSGWSITGGSGTNTITVSIGAGFMQGQLRVNAISSCGIKGNARTITINSTPATPGIISGPATICNGNTYIFSITSVAGAASYQWSLPTGVTFTSGPPSNTNSISVDVGGGFSGGQICVTALTSCGGVSVQRCITVSPNPPAPGNISGPAAVCAGASAVNYTIAAVAGASNYNWIVPSNMTIASGQGTNSLSVNIGGGFISGSLCVEALSSCGTPGLSSCLPVSLTPASPATISQQANFCPGSTRTLTAGIVSGAASYTWSVPGGLTILNGQGTTVITVAIDGAFSSGSVCVTANSSCSAASTQHCETISVNPPASPTSITSSAMVCAGSNVVLSIPLISGVGSVNWTLPSGMNIVSGQGSPTVTVSVDPGFSSGAVCVVTSSGCGAASSQYCQNFSITPATPGSISAPSNVCASDPEVVFGVASIVGVSSYNWIVPADMTITSGQGSNVISVSTSPTFTSGTVSVTAVSACSVQGSARSITVGSTLGQPSNISGPTYVCPNSSGVVFSIPAVTSAASYNWILPADMTITAGLNTNSITVSTGAIFSGGQISVAAVSVCGISGPPRTLTVGFNIGSPGVITAPFAICANTTGIAISVPALATALSYNWYLPAGLTITAGTGSNAITVSAGPSFTGGQICVEAVSICGNVGAQRCTTLVNLPTQPGGVTGTSKGVCGLTLQYSVQPAPGSSTYNWTAPLGATIVSGQGTRIVQVSFTNSFVSGQLQVFTSNACGNSTVRNSSVLTGAPDKPVAITGPNSVCANSIGNAYSVAAVFGATTYNWTAPAGTSISGNGTNSVLINWGTTPGNISVTTTNTCGTSATATTLSVGITCRMSLTTNPQTKLNVYPNPAAEEFVVEYDSANESGYQFELVDLSGRIVMSMSQTATIGLNKIVFDVRDLPRGAYVLKIAGDDQHNGHARVILQ